MNIFTIIIVPALFCISQISISNAQTREDAVFAAKCRAKWNMSGQLCNLRAQAFCARRPSEDICRAYAAVKDSQSSGTARQQRPQNDRTRGRNSNTNTDNSRAANNRNNNNNRNRDNNGGRGGRNNNANRSGKNNRTRDCSSKNGKNRAKCEALNQCRLLTNKAQRQNCKKEARCSQHSGQKRQDCLSKQSCKDLADAQDQATCRVNKHCRKKKGSDKARCESVAKLDCDSKADGAEKDQCMSERLCGYLQGQQRRDCVDEAKDRCNKITDDDDKEECYEDRRPKKASKLQMDSLKSAMNSVARQKAQTSSRRVMGQRPKIAQRNPQAVVQHSEQSVNAKAGTDLLGGDMALTNSQLSDIQADLPRSGRKKRKVGKSPYYQLWEAFPISYQFDSSINTATRAKIRQGIKLWEDNTCVRWQENGPDSDRVEFYNGGGCSSYVGRTGGVQEISIATPGCDFLGIITHEIGHSLGFMHEQARPDQDQHVNIVYNNINPFRWNNFLPAQRNEVNDYSIPYDYGSVMHYDGTAFANDYSKLTIQTIDPLAQQTIGQRNGPSFVDFAQVNAAYCGSKCSRKLSCQHQGYTDPNNCNICKCPTGFAGNLCQNRQSSSCGGDIIASRNAQNIQSPSYPNRYGSNQECIWKIRTDSGYKITLQFESTFEFSCKDSCDESHVEVKLGGDWRKTGYRFCCSERPTQQFTSKDNELVVIFRNNGGPTKRGFRAAITSNAPGAPGPNTTPRPTARTTTRRGATTRRTTTARPTTNQAGCRCGQWTSWSSCSYHCGGCGRIKRTRSCSGADKCYASEERSCNKTPCASSQPISLATEKGFHILVQGCCFGAFKGPDGQCGPNFNFGGAVEKIVSGAGGNGGAGGGNPLTNIFGGGGNTGGTGPGGFDISRLGNLFRGR